MSKPLTRYALESYVQGFHERHEMTADPDGRWYAKDEADALIASLEAEVARLREDAERYRWLKKDRDRGAETLTRWMDVDAAIDAARGKK